MKAVVQTRYGPSDEVLQVRDVEHPTPRADEVLISVRAASLHPDVWHVVTGRPWILRLMGSGLLQPRIVVPGTDLAGIVEEVGCRVSRFKRGDEVFGESHKRIQWVNGGAFAEFAVAPADVLARKPAAISFEEAATIPTAGYIALSNLACGARIKEGAKILINGAGGGVGSIALQLAKAKGARVTGVDRTEKLEMILSLGADSVVDFTQEDVTLRNERYDLIVDVASTLTIGTSKRILAPGGSWIPIGHDHFGQGAGRVFGSLPRFLTLMAIRRFVSHLPEPAGPMPTKNEVMRLLAELIETGKLRSVVTRTFSLDEVREAMHCLQQGRVPGRIVITPSRASAQSGRGFDST